MGRLRVTMLHTLLLPALSGAAAARGLMRHHRAVHRARAAMSTLAPSLDAKLVADSPDVVAEALRRRRAPQQQLDALATIGELQKRRGELSGAISTKLGIRRQLSPKIGALLKEGKAEEAEILKSEVAGASAEAKAMEAELEGLERERDALLAALPNLLDPRVPDGASEEDNELVASWTPEDRPTREGGMWHDEVAAGLGGLDTERAAKLSGARFAVLKGHVARLERALANFFLDMHVQEHGYTECAVPYIVGRSALEGTGQLPKFEEDLFRLSEELNGRDAFLIPTAEVPLTNLHAGEILSEADLPLAFVAFTPCFRAEAGSYGKDTKGLIRQHQFHKVELVRVTTPETAAEEHEALTAHAEACLRALKLPYRKMRLCSGDIGFSATHCYDLEVWLPGQGAFREISSCSHCGDFQARRMQLRYRPAQAPAEGGKKNQAAKPVLCHTINGSGLAVGRALVAVLENYQDDDGSVEVPEVLRPYMGGLERIQPAGR